MRIVARSNEAARDVQVFVIDGDGGRKKIEVSGHEFIVSRYETPEEVAYAKYLSEARKVHGGGGAQPAVREESGSPTIGGPGIPQG